MLGSSTLSVGVLILAAPTLQRTSLLVKQINIVFVEQLSLQAIPLLVSRLIYLQLNLSSRIIARMGRTGSVSLLWKRWSRSLSEI